MLIPNEPPSAHFSPQCSGAIRMVLSTFIEILQHFKDEGYGGQIAVSISVAILTSFTDFNVFWLWIDQFA